MCTVHYDDNDGWAYDRTRLRMAKVRTCEGCNTRVHKGFSGVRIITAREGEIEYSYACLDCDKALQLFGDAHDVQLYPHALRESLEACIVESEDEGEDPGAWPALLAELDARMAVARLQKRLDLPAPPDAKGDE